MIGAGAVVSRDVARSMIVGGVPAKLIRQRLDEPLAAQMQDLAWWDWQHDRLHAALEDFRSLISEDFAARYG